FYPRLSTPPTGAWHTLPLPWPRQCAHDILVTSFRSRNCATILGKLPTHAGRAVASRRPVLETMQMRPIRRRPVTLLLLSQLTSAALGALALPAGASQINTGASTGVYATSFCPVLSQQLKLAQFDYRCTSSAGTRENMERGLANPRQLGYGQLDVFALESRQ